MTHFCNDIAASPRATVSDHHVRLSLPATPPFARLARITAAMLAGNAGFSFDEVEDVRIGVNEACVFLVGPSLAERTESSNAAQTSPSAADDDAGAFAADLWGIDEQGDRLDVYLNDGDGVLTIELVRSPGSGEERADAATSPSDPHELTTQILDAVVDSFEVDTSDNSTTSVRLAKRHARVD